MEQEQFKKIASLFLNEIEPELFQAKDFYELEQISQQLFKKLFKETMDLHLNPHEIVDQRKKKNIKAEWAELTVSVDSAHYDYCKNAHTKLSPLLEQKAVYLGAMLPYETASESLKTLIDVEISDSTIYRLTDRIGNIAKEKIEKEDTFQQETESLFGFNERCYAQLDGTMIQIREEGWKEVKLARVFKGDDIINKGNRQGIVHSVYGAVLGNKEEFEKQILKILHQGIDAHSELIFTTDGAVWIRQMIEKLYPQAISILDYYHLVEHIGKYVEVNYNKGFRTTKMEKWKEVLIQKGGIELQKEIIATRTKSKKAMQEKINLINYLEGNKNRMDYPMYEKENYYIGSGAIESAHRHVIQTRMKRSGQLWSRKGAEKMLSLRIVLKNGNFKLLFNFEQNINFKAA